MLPIEQLKKKEYRSVKDKKLFRCSPSCVTIQSSYGSSSPQWLLWISESRCSRTQRMMHRWCPWWCGQERGTAPGSTDDGVNFKSCILKWGKKHCSALRWVLPSTSWKCSLNSSDPHSQSHLSWMSLHTGRRPGTCPSHKEMEDEEGEGEAEAACSCPPPIPCYDWSGSPSAFDLHPRLHPIFG